MEREDEHATDGIPAMDEQIWEENSHEPMEISQIEEREKQIQPENEEEVK